MILVAIDRKTSHQVNLNDNTLFPPAFCISSGKENYALEKYSPESKCFDHGSTWEQYVDQCQRRRRIWPQTAGCYQVYANTPTFLSIFFLLLV